VAHWEDYQFDRQSLGRGGSSPVLAWLYRRFVRWTAAHVPGQIPFAAREPAFRIKAFDQETRRFDVLAAHYGDCYRGSAVANYHLGVLAVVFALGAVLIAPLDETSLLGRPLGACAAQVALCAGIVRHWMDLPVLTGGLEIVVLGVILAVHLKGRGSDRGPDDARPGGARWWTERWHSRWLDYRGLAERFRYASLRGLLGGPASVPAPGTDEATGEDWCVRYFRETLRQAAWPSVPEADHAANLLAAIDEQQRYHHGNSQRCHRLAHRLHRVTVWAFGLAGAVTIVELALLLGLPTHFGLPTALAHGAASHPHSNLWILATAGLPTYAAAVHGIQNACEYAKIARSSHDMFEALTKERVAVEALLARDPAFARDDSRAELRDWTERFLHLSTDEATGWRAALADKNVPLP
jgi:hypothetical protein